MHEYIEFDSKTLPLWFGLGLSLAVAVLLGLLLLLRAIARRILRLRGSDEEERGHSAADA